MCRTFRAITLIMSTTIEHLPVEIWFQTFVYLKASDRFKAFSNLNKRLDDILLASQTKISLKNHDDEAYYLLRHVLPKLTHRQYVTGLRLERTNKVSTMLRAPFGYDARML